MSSRFQLSLASGERGGWRAAAAAVGRLACSAESLVAELSQRSVCGVGCVAYLYVK